MEFRRVLFRSNATALLVAAGGLHACALLDTGELKCWGQNGKGQLGQGDNDPRGGEPNQMGDKLLPINLGAGRIAVAVTAGYEHTCALLDSGSLKCWGDNSNGQLGWWDTSSRGDSENDMGDNLAAIDLGPDRTAVAVAAGERFTCAILDNGWVKCWGNNDQNQVGPQATKPWTGDPVDVNLGADYTALSLGLGIAHAIALLNGDIVKGWGSDDAGELGHDPPNAVDLGTSLFPV